MSLLLLLLLLFLLLTIFPKQTTPKNPDSLSLRLTHRELKNNTTSILHCLARDGHRIERVAVQQTETPPEKNSNKSRRRGALEKRGDLSSSLKSGASIGSGEYLMDVYIGTPPLHFSMIVDTGSDLNWIQCAPCLACFRQNGPLYTPSLSSSFKNISCTHPLCSFPTPCLSHSQPCKYLYSYGDNSTTTGDLSLDSFTLNTSSEGKNSGVEEIVMGCGHENRGLFHGAAGLLGFGRGPLSFPSQLGHSSFSYCLVPRTSRASSPLLFSHGDRHLLLPHMNFTSFSPQKGATFYYLKIEKISVGGELVRSSTSFYSSSDSSSTIVDSGTTLTYFPSSVFGGIKEAFVRRVGAGVGLVEGFPMLWPCYNISGVDLDEGLLPGLEIFFKDGGVWSFPSQNCFIEIEEGEVACLAMLPTPHSEMTIIGNFQQQDFQVVYDNKRSRLGFAPARCAHLSSSSSSPH